MRGIKTLLLQQAASDKLRTLRKHTESFLYSLAARMARYRKTKRNKKITRVIDRILGNALLTSDGLLARMDSCFLI